MKSIALPKRLLPSGSQRTLSTMSDNNILLSSFEFQVVEEYSSLFCGVLLSYWDNIMGPRVERLWHGNNKVSLDKELISFVTSHTLNGELCRVTEEGQTDMKLYVLSDRGYLFSASIFLGLSKHGQTVFSLTFIMAADDLHKYLELQQFLNNQVALLVMKLRVLQEKVRLSIFVIACSLCIISTKKPSQFACIISISVRKPAKQYDSPSVTTYEEVRCSWLDFPKVHTLRNIKAIDEILHAYGSNPCHSRTSWNFLDLPAQSVRIF